MLTNFLLTYQISEMIPETSEDNKLLNSNKKNLRSIFRTMMEPNMMDFGQ